jgi:copper homeostasis protein
MTRVGIYVDDVGGAAAAAAGGTSGGEPAVENVPELRTLVARADGRAEVMVGGGVRPGNAARVAAAIGAPAAHVRAAAPIASDGVGRAVSTTCLTM